MAADDDQRLIDCEKRLEHLEAAAAKLKPIVKRNTNTLRSLTIFLVFLITIGFATISPKWSSDGVLSVETRVLTIEVIVAGSVCVFLVFNKNADATVGKLLDRILRK